MSYALWLKENGGPEFQNENITSVNSVKINGPVRDSPEDTSDTHAPAHVFKETPVRPSVKYRSFRYKGVRQRQLEASAEHSGVQAGQATHSKLLRLIKIVALIIIAACTLVGTVFSKITFVSITGRMYSLTLATGSDADQSQLFVQLVFILIVPEVVSFLHSLAWGVIGKTDTSYPWPSWRAVILVSA